MCGRCLLFKAKAICSAHSNMNIKNYLCTIGFTRINSGISVYRTSKGDSDSHFCVVGW